MTDLNSDYPTLSPKRVVVAMSGGVDSSVAAALLVEQGYEVIGMMMRLWSEPANGRPLATNRCCTPDQMVDARRVADRLNIPFYVLDVQDYFRKTIVQFFIDEHEAGRTPNPCIECNRQIRFTYLMEQALTLGADYLATGHYARIRRTSSGFKLLKAIDANKDQSYVLHVLGQEQLAHVLFPLGEFTKDEVREIARDRGLAVASKQESQDLCFLKDNDYRRFLRDHSAGIRQPGSILTEDGREVGHHDGLAFYTIGQRKGLGISAPEPLFVIRKDHDLNALIVGPREALGCRSLYATKVNWVSGSPPAKSIPVEVKIRYKANPVAATLNAIGSKAVEIQFNEPVFGITSGQGAVFFDGDVCLGGGIITDPQNPNAAAQDSVEIAHSIPLEVIS